MHELARLFRLYRPFALWMGAGVGLGLATVLANFGLLALAAWFLTTTAAIGLAGYAAQNAFNFFTPAAGVRFFATVRVVARYASRLVDHETTFRQIAALRVFLFAHLIPLAPLGLTERSGDILTRLLSDIERLSDFYPRVLVPTFVAALASIVMALVFAAIAPVSGLVLFFLLLAAAAVPLIGMRIAAKPSARIVALESAFRADIVDTMQGMPDLLTHGAAPRMSERLERASEHLLASEYGKRSAGAWMGASTGLITNLAMIAMLLIGVPLVRAGQIDRADLALLVLGALAAFEAVVPLGQALPLVPGIRESARRVFDVADRAPPVADPKRSSSRPSRLDFEIRGVRLWYPDTDHAARAPVLDGLDLSIPEGSRLILLGRSGAGKTTIANLLLRIVEYQEGSATLGGVELRDIRGDDIRSLFTVVTQKTFLFHGSIRDNLLLARPDASDALLWQALETTRLADFVRAAPRGLDTPVGEGGAQISGGEARRIALTRAVLRDTPWLILDEPTEGLDPATAQTVLSTLKNVMARRTVLLITHRLDALAQGSDVAILEAGRVIEHGAFEVLSYRRTHFAHLLALTRRMAHV